MSVTEQTGGPSFHGGGNDTPQLRAGIAWTGAIGLCLAAALGISAILGASLGTTAIRLAGSGFICGLDALFAVAAATLSQRSPALRIPAITGVVAGVIAVAVSLFSVWGANVGETLGRIALVAGLLASELGLSGLLVSQQRDEDPLIVRRLMAMTLLLDWVLTIALDD